MFDIAESHKLIAHKIKNDFDDIAYSYDKLDSFSRCYDEFFFELFPVGSLNILDVGSGTGGQAEASSRIRKDDKWTLVDISPNMILLARQRLKNKQSIMKFVVGDIFTDEIKLTESSFNVIIANKVFHDYPIDEYIRAIEVLSKYLKKDGILIIGDVTASRKVIYGWLDAMGEFFWRLFNMSFKDTLKYYYYKIKTPSIKWKEHLKKEPKLTMPRIKNILLENFPDGFFKIIHPHFYFFVIRKGE